MADEHSSAEAFFTGTPRERAAAALRRLGHALIATDADPHLLERIAAQAEQTAIRIEREGAPRSRPIERLKRELYLDAPPDGARMSHFPECVVSGPENPMGIAIQVHRDGDEAVADLHLGPAFEGAPQRAHGGVIAAVFDDVMGYVLVILRQPAYTGQLTIHYRAPVPVGVDLSVRARVVGREGRKLFMASEMTQDGKLLCDAEGVFIAIDPARFGLL